jgi:thioesterase domain-containing protein
VHAIGGTVFSYGELARALPGRPVWGVQTPAVENGAEPQRDVVAMASEYVAAVQAVDPEGPYLLGGWSFGGVVAFEMARQLRERGREVGLLALFDSWAPVRMDFPLDRGELDLLRGFLRDQAGMLGREAGWIDEEPPAMPEEERPLWLLGRARSAGLLQAEVKPERVRRLLGVYRANLEAYAGYRPERWNAAITLYRPAVTLDQPTPRPANGWEELSSGPIEVHTVPGDHYTMLAPPGVLALSELLGERLERAVRERVER